MDLLQQFFCLSFTQLACVFLACGHIYSPIKMSAQGLAFPLLCVIGCIAQQFSLYKESLLYKIPLTRSCWENTYTLRGIFFFGVIFEVISASQLSLLQFFILSCAHLLTFKLNYSKDYEVSFVQAEKLSFILFTCAGILTFLVPISNFSTEEVLLDFFVMYQVCGAGILVVMRKLGFFNRKILLEASIPAHFTVGLIAGCRILADLYLKNEGNPEFFDLKAVVFPSVLAALIFMGLSSSFLRGFVKYNDTVVVYGAYLAWTIFFGFVLTYSLQFEKIDKYTMVYLTSGTLAVSGNLLIVFQRTEYLKAVHEKNVASGLEREIAGEETEDIEDPQHLELHIDEENLMDAEIIDEDLLIKTIRNI